MRLVMPRTDVELVRKDHALLDARAGYAPLWFILLAGYLAAWVTLMSPLAMLAGNLALVEFAALMRGSVQLHYGAQDVIAQFKTTFAQVGPGISLLALGGAGLAALRRRSVRLDQWVRIPWGSDHEIRLGGHTLSACLITPFALLYTWQRIGWLNIAAWLNLDLVVSGILFDLVWETLHNHTLAFWQPDAVLQQALGLRAVLQLHCREFEDFVPIRILMDETPGVAIIEAHYEHAATPSRIKRLLEQSHVPGLQRLIIRAPSPDRNPPARLHVDLRAPRRVPFSAPRQSYSDRHDAPAHERRRRTPARP